MKRAADGTFQRVRGVWDGAFWDDGYVDAAGRFRVYRPDYPRVYAEGYALRAHVVWWLRYGECHPSGHVLHHMNGDKSDDRLVNLELWEHGVHTRLHCLGREKIKLECSGCGCNFEIPKFRFTAKSKHGQGRFFCSPDCYQATGRSLETRRKISLGLRRAHAEGRR